MTSHTEQQETKEQGDATLSEATPSEATPRKSLPLPGSVYLFQKLTKGKSEIVLYLGALLFTEQKLFVEQLIQIIESDNEEDRKIRMILHLVYKATAAKSREGRDFASPFGCNPPALLELLARFDPGNDIKTEWEAEYYTF